MVHKTIFQVFWSHMIALGEEQTKFEDAFNDNHLHN